MDALPWGPFTNSDLAAYGLTRKRLRTLVAAGSVRRVVRGVYVAAPAVDSFELRAACLLRVVSPGQVIIDRTAAWLHGVDVYARAELELGVAVETCGLRGRNPTRRQDADGHTRDLAPIDVMTLDGLLVTTPTRTALDLGCHLRRREAFAALCGLARAHEIAPTVLAAGVTRFGGRRGVVQLRELVPLVDTRLESAREAWTLLAIHDAGLPLPLPQLWIEIDDVPTYRLDFAYPDLRVCVEYDGFEAHQRSEEQRRYDADRRRWLRDHGWRIVVVRLGDFTGTSLDRWLHQLRAALRESAYSTRRW